VNGLDAVGAALEAAQAPRRRRESAGFFGLAAPTCSLGSRKSCPYCISLSTQQRLTWRLWAMACPRPV